MHQSNLISALACSTRLRVHRSDASLTLCFASLNRENNVKSGMPVHRFNKPSVETFPDSHTILTNFVLTLYKVPSYSFIINYIIVWSPLHSINLNSIVNLTRFTLFIYKLHISFREIFLTFIKIILGRRNHINMLMLSRHSDEKILK